MKTRILEFVERRQAILDEKLTHNKDVNMGSFIMQSIVIGMILFGSVLLFGMIGNLNSELNYMFISVNVMMVLLYGLLRYQFELKYQYINKLEYKVRYVLLPDILHMIFVLTLVSGVVIYPTMLVYFNELNATVIGVVLFVVVVFYSVSMFVLQRFMNVKVEFGRSVKSAIVVFLLFSSIMAILPTMDISINYYVSSVVFIIVYIFKEYTYSDANRKLLQYSTRIFVVLFLASAIVEMPIYATREEENQVLDLFVRGKVVGTVSEDRVMGVVTNEEYIFVKYFHQNHNYIEVYDMEFNYVTTQTNFESVFTVYEEKGDIYIQETYGIEGTRISKFSEDLVFEEIIYLDDVNSNLMFVEIDGEYYTATAFYNVDQSVDLEQSIYKYVDGTLEVATDMDNGILYQSDETVFVKEEEYIVLNTNHSFITDSDVFLSNSIEDLEEKYKYYADGVFVSQYFDYTITSVEGEVIADGIDRMASTYYGAYPTEFASFRATEDYVRFYARSGQGMNEQVYVYAYQYDYESERLYKYGSDNCIFQVGPQTYELIDGEVYKLEETEQVGMDQYDTLEDQIYFSTMFFAMGFFTTLKTRKFVFKGGKSNV